MSAYKRVTRSLLSVWVIAYQYSNWLNFDVHICASDKNGQISADLYRARARIYRNTLSSPPLLACSSIRLLAREVRELVKTAGCKGRKCFIYTAYPVVEIDFIIPMAGGN